MFSAAELLEALRRRRTLKSIRPDAPGRLPPGWQRWLEAMPPRAGAVTGAAPAGFVDAFLQRPLHAPPRRAELLGRWQAFLRLWRQQWDPPRRDERGLRIGAMATSLAMHACLVAAMVWLMQFSLLVQPPAAGESHVVQVEYVGRGTPEETGGGPVPPERAAQDAPTAAAAPAPPAEPSDADGEAPRPPALRDLPVEVAAPTVAAAVPPLPQREVPAPTLPERAQPLQVTEVERPDIDFVLPPPTTARVDPLPAPELAVPRRDVPAPEVVEAEPAEVAQLPERAVAAPAVATRPSTLRIPEVAVATLPDPERSPEPAAAPATAAPSEPAASAPSEAIADGASRQASTAADPAEGARVAGASDVAADAADAAATSGADAGAQVLAGPEGAGPATAAAPGGWPSPTRGDDWDDALRNRPGGRAAEGSGLFDSTGQPRLAGSGERGPPGGAPPGSAAREAIDLERGGTWLRRPGLDHRATRFDGIWIPSGTLLEEWVRRGVREMSIPVPGTSKEIVCVVSLLQLGGGCGVRDPDLNDQPSTGRPAPEVPFRPDLQEDQDSLARPPGG